MWLMITCEIEQNSCESSLEGYLASWGNPRQGYFGPCLSVGDATEGVCWDLTETIDLDLSQNSK
jgi:hypothetical protein